MQTILIVDDEPAIRRLIRAALQGSGYRLLEEADGVSALETARREQPDLILLDIALPHMSGLEVCRRLKAGPATADVPIFLLTGLVQQVERRAAEDTGADGFIAKPFSPAALVAQIAEALRPQTALAPR